MPLNALNNMFVMLGPDDLEEPEGFASGDMKKFLENPENYEKEDNDDRQDGK